MGLGQVAAYYNQASGLEPEERKLISQSTPTRLHGIGASRGIAFGRIAFLKRNKLPSEKQHIRNVKRELERFEKARDDAIKQLDHLYEISLDKLGEQNAVLFQIHQMMLDDPEYLQGITEMISKEHVNAEYATLVTAKRLAKNFEAADNDYIKGRAADVMDISRRVIEIMLDHSGLLQHQHMYTEYDDDPIILATDDLAPSETVQIDQHQVSGIITSKGSSQSHTVIFAKTMDLPAIISIGDNLMSSMEGKYAIVDGTKGIVIVEPDMHTLSFYRDQKRTDVAKGSRVEQFRGKETLTASGRKINLYANIASLSDLDLAIKSDAEGIGLFRSEFIYLSSKDFPTEEEQFAVFKEVLQKMKGKKVVIRTMDIGADKSADYFMLKPEDNPAMGMRAVRICLTNVELFKTHLRALYRASAFGTLAIMFPMISSTDEITQCKEICLEVQKELEKEGKDYSNSVELGIMIETPASALISDELAPLVDFFSIGSNDLTQFTLAVDRQNTQITRFLNPYHHGVIKLIKMTIENAHKHGIWVGICGELGADEAFTRQLVEYGIDEISVVPSNILTLRARISTFG